MKKNVLALVALLVLGVAVWFVSRNDKSEESPDRKESLPFPVDTSGIDRLEILRHEGSGTTLREERIVMGLGESGWHIIEPINYRAHQELVEMMITALDGIRVIDAISDNPAKHRALEVDREFGIGVRALAGGAERLHFIVGVTQGEITFVRLPESDTVYRTTGSYRTRFNKSTNQLRDKMLVQVDRGSISRMKFSNQKGELEMRRSGEGEGEGEGETFLPGGPEILNFDAERALLSARAIPLLMTRSFSDELIGEDVTGLGDQADFLEFDGTLHGQKKTYRIWMGNEIEKVRQTYVKTSESDQLFLVSSHVISRYRLGAEDFARTDEEVRQQAEAAEKYREHAKLHQHGGNTESGEEEAGHNHDHDHDHDHDHSPNQGKDHSPDQGKDHRLGPDGHP